MPVENVLYESGLILDDSPDLLTRVYLGSYMGSYMPFAGVRYFTILDDILFVEGRDRTGAVGWRLPKTSTREEKEEEKAPSRVLVAI